MNSDRDFTSVLTWLGIGLGVITLAASIFAVFRFTNQNNPQTAAVTPTPTQYNCVPASPTSGTYSLSFQSTPNVTLQFPLASTESVCQITIGDPSNFKVWWVSAGSTPPPVLTQADYTIGILKQAGQTDVAAVAKSYRDRLTTNKQAGDTITNLTLAGHDATQYDYTQSGVKKRQYQIYVSKDFVVLVLTTPDNTTINDLVHNLKVS